MPKNLLPLSLEAPGFFGLNTQHSGSALHPGWATVLSNFVYDDIGRLASRKGNQELHSNTVTSDVRQIHEYIDTSGSLVTIYSANNKIWKIVGTTATDISGTITTPTADNWQFANFNGKCIGYQEGHAPIEMTTVGGSFVNSSGTMYNGSMVLSAWGRSWTVSNNTLYYSDLLIHNYAGGSSGSADLSLYWPNGMDEAVALADFNGYLIIFGKESIIVVQGAEVPTSMEIVEGIDGVGCTARDSVQVVGKDLLFLSSTGVRSLGRVIQEKSVPLGDVSQNVRDDLLNQVSSETNLQHIKSIYNREEGFYAISFPVSGTSYCFDLKFPNEDGTLKATTWDYGFTAAEYTQDLDHLLARRTGFISKYTNYLDNSDYLAASGVTYNVLYEGVWYNFGEEVASNLKLLKRGSVLANGVQGTVTFRWAVDYNPTFSSGLLTFPTISPPLFGVSEFGVDTFLGSTDFNRVRTPLSKAGQVVKVGLQAEVNNIKFALQRIDLLVKVGRIGI